jgi:glycosyltransferase involved in cell wall biosynthesis
MACGRPTVVAARGSLPEVVGDTGLLIDPEQPESLIAALAQAIDDGAWRAASGAAGRARAAAFTWRATAEAVRAVYRAVLN